MERIDIYDELHMGLVRISEEAETLQPFGIVWNNPLHKKRPDKRDGLALIQTPDQLLTRRFTVEFTDRSFTLKFLGKMRTFTSDYFEGT